MRLLRSYAPERKETFKKYELIGKPYSTLLNFDTDDDGNVVYGYGLSSGSETTLANVKAGEKVFASKLNGRIFFFTRSVSDKIVCFNESATATEIATTDKAGSLTVKKSAGAGKEVVFITDGKKTYIFDGETVTESVVPPFKDLCDFCGATAVITADDAKTLFIGGVSDSEADLSLNGAVYVTLPESAEGLYSLNDDLYIFCKKAIYRLSAEESRRNYKLEPAFGLKRDYISDSLVKVRNKAVFMTGDGIHVFDGKKIIKNNFFNNTEDKDVSVSHCFCADGRYVARVLKFGIPVFVYYNAEKDNGGVIFDFATEPVVDAGGGEVFYGRTSTGVKPMVRQTNATPGSCKITYKINFGNKRITLGKVYSKGTSAGFIVNGGGGDATFSFKNGDYTDVRLSGKEILITLTNASASCKIEKITLYIKEN